MDYFAHGFWSYLIFHDRKRFGLAVLFGLLPDTLSFFLYFLYRLATDPMGLGPPDPAEIPGWVWMMYGISHSLIVCTLIFLIIFLFLKKIPYYVWTWPIAITIDIFTHSREYLPTPFLWPLSDWKFPGISWGTPWFMITNYVFIISGFVWVGWKRRKGRLVVDKMLKKN